MITEAKKPRKKKPSGAAAIAAAGRVAIVIAVSPEDREAIRIAAAKDGLGSSPWLRKIAIEAAKARGVRPKSKPAKTAG